MRPLNILMLIPHIGAGGDWTAARTMAEGLRRRGHTLHLASANARAVPAGLFASITEVEINRGTPRLLRSVWRSARRFPDDIDILHAHSSSALMFALALRRLRCHRARVMMSYIWHSPEAGLTLLAKRFLLRRAGLVHVHSYDSEAYFNSRYKIPARAVRLLHLGTDTRAFPYVGDDEKAAFRAALGLPTGALVLLFSGRHNPEKNIPIIFRYLERHGASLPNVHFLLTSDGPQNAELRRMAAASPVRERIRFLGYVDDLRKVYGAADLLILPSTDMETFGLVCVEAGLCGTPVLRSDIAGATDQIVEGINGWTYPRFDEEAFDRQLGRLIANPGLLRPAGREARRIYLERFDLEMITTRLEEFYAEMLA